MNKLGKIAPLVVIVACAVSLFFAYTLGGRQSQLKSDNLRLDREVNSKNSLLADAQKRLAEVDVRLQDAGNAVTTATANMQEAIAERDRAREEAETMRASMADMKDRLEDTESKLAGATQTLEKLQAAAGPEGLENIAQITDKLAALGDENKLLSEQLATLRTDKKRMEQELQEMRTTPAGLRGRVAHVEEAWNFLVLNIGQQHRVQPNTEFIVYRDDKLVGKVQVVSVNPDTSIANILPGYGKGALKPGDVAIH
jgi:DNA repair exonuclease SbcCD ATPase subunit